MSQSIIALNIFFVAAFGWIFREENISIPEIGTMIGGFCGVFILVNPNIFDIIKSDKPYLDKVNKEDNK